MDWSWEQFQAYWRLVRDIWQEGVYGVDVSELLLALAIFLIFLVLRHLLKRFVLAWASALARRTPTALDDAVVEAMEKPVSFLPVAMGFYFATSTLTLTPGLALFVDNVNRSLAAYLIFWTLYRAVSPVSHVLEQSSRLLTPEISAWLMKLARVVFAILGAATILEIWGIDVAPLIAGLGLFGVAVALGAQDLFKNLIAGLFIISERRFHRGEWILVDGVAEGTVEDIGFRTTKIRRFDKAPVYVPNAQLADNAIINFTRMSHRRIKWIIGLEYRTTREQLRQVRDGIEAYITNSDAFAPASEVPMFVRIDGFNDSSIDILLYCFTRTTKWGEWLKIKEELAYQVKEIVEGAGTGCAFPSQSVYVETVPDAAEVFPLHQRPSEAAE